MRILFYEPYTINTPHYETCLELIQEHLDAGDEVIFLGCDGQMKSCAPNIHHDVLACKRCVSKRKSGFKLLDKTIEYRSFYKMTDKNLKALSLLKKDFKNVKELQSYTYKGYDIGYAVASSLITKFRDSRLDLQLIKPILNNLMESAFTVYCSINNILEETKVDRVYIFNGRFDGLRAVLRTCQTKGIDCFIHERGSNIQKYALYKNYLPHNPAYLDRLIKEKWNNTDKEIRTKVAKQFYIDRKNAKRQYWDSFVGGQKKGLLPKNWNKTKRNIVIFNSSEDEFASIGKDWDLPFYKNQIEGIQKIISDFKTDSNIQFYFRVHPNLKSVDNQTKREMLALGTINLTIIPPESEISTYALIDHCDTVISFGSTVGVEASFWDKPSILIGIGLYRQLKSTYTPETHQETIELIKQHPLKPLDKTGALMYGFYMNTFGKEFKFYQATDLFEGTFKGETVKESLGVKLYSGIGSRLKKYASKI